MFIFEGNEIETDSEGYLKDTTQWSEAMAEVIAAQEGITLAVEHWEVVRFVREFYLEFNTSPAIRMLVKAMANKFGEEKGNSRYPCDGQSVCLAVQHLCQPAEHPGLRQPGLTAPLLNRGLAYAGPFFLLHCGQFQAVCEKSCLFLKATKLKRIAKAI